MRLPLTTRRSLGLAGLLALTTLASTSAPSQAATWSPPATVSSPATFIENTFIGFGTGATGLATWTYVTGNDSGSGFSGGARAAVREPSGAFGPERERPAARLTIFGRERVVAISQRDRGGRRELRAAFGTLRGDLGRAPRTVARFRPTLVPGHGNSFDVAANDRGDVALAYLQQVPGSRRAVTLVERRPGGRFGVSQIIGGRGRAAFAVAVALNARGDLVVAWQRGDSIEARVRRHGGRLGPVQRVGPAVPQSTLVHAAVARSGAAWVAWESQRLTEGGDNGPFVVRVAARPASAKAFPRTGSLLETSAARVNAESRVDLALDPAGAAYVAYSIRGRARLATVSAGGTKRTIRTLSASDYLAAVRDVATGPRRGEALVVWTRLDDVGELGTQVLAGPIAADGSFAGEEAVSDADRARLPAAAFDPVSGLPTVVWSQRIGPDGSGVPVSQVRTVLRAATRSPSSSADVTP